MPPNPIYAARGIGPSLARFFHGRQCQAGHGVMRIRFAAFIHDNRVIFNYGKSDHEQYPSKSTAYGFRSRSRDRRAGLAPHIVGMGILSGAQVGTIISQPVLIVVDTDDQLAYEGGSQYETEGYEMNTNTKHAADTVDALRQIVAMLDQPVQYSDTRDAAAVNILRCDCEVAREIARAAIAKATGE